MPISSSSRRGRNWFRWNPKGHWKDWQRRRLLRRAGIVVDRPVSLTWLGDGSGAWPVLVGSLPTNPMVWSFGIGRDLSFEEQIVTQFGARCYAFDPTPRSREWIATQRLPAAIECVAVGLSDRVGRELFCAPRRSTSANFVPAASVVEGASYGAIECEVATLHELRSRYSGAIDILKVDIEGGEYAVVEDLAESGATQVLIEFHHGMRGISFGQTLAAIESFRLAGFRIFWTSRRGLELGFVREEGA